MKIIDEQSVGVLLGVPTLGRGVCPDMLFVVASLSPPINYFVQSTVVWGKEIAEARNLLAQQAVSMNARYLFFLGDDTHVPGHTLKQLIYRMEHDPKLGVVGGVYCSKSNPPAPLVFRGNGVGSFWDWKAGEFFQVTGLGMDCTMIRVEMLKELEPPWFKTVREDRYLDGIPKSEAWTEDLWFCNRVTKETDWECWIDSMVIAKHWQNIGGNSWEYFTLRNDAKPFLRQPRKKRQKQILDLGCGPVHFDFSGEGEVTRCDIREECSPDWRIDIRQLPFKDEDYDVVFSSHTLEHFPRVEIPEILTEWVRVLKAGGELRLIVPNLAWAAEKILEGTVDDDVLNVLYGSQEYKENFHRVGFTPLCLTQLVEKVGIREVKISVSGYNLLLEGKKRGKKDAVRLRRRKSAR